MSYCHLNGVFDKKGKSRENALCLTICAQRDLLRGSSCLPNRILEVEPLLSFHHFYEPAGRSSRRASLLIHQVPRLISPNVSEPAHWIYIPSLHYSTIRNFGLWPLLIMLSVLLEITKNFQILIENWRINFLDTMIRTKSLYTMEKSIVEHFM